MTPLHVAAKRGVNSDIMKYLVDNKADINIKDNYGVSTRSDMASPHDLVNIWALPSDEVLDNEVQYVISYI